MHLWPWVLATWLVPAVGQIGWQELLARHRKIRPFEPFSERCLRAILWPFVLIGYGWLLIQGDPDPQ